jgi:polyisoprenoid-binding protein YceI
VTIRGHTRPVEFDVAYLGQWESPFWVGDDNRAAMRRIGFEGWTRVDRHQFGVSWQDELPGGGRVVGDDIDLVLDVEAIHRGDLERTGAIDYYEKGG